MIIKLHVLLNYETVTFCLCSSPHCLHHLEEESYIAVWDVCVCMHVFGCVFLSVFTRQLHTYLRIFEAITYIVYDTKCRCLWVMCVVCVTVCTVHVFVCEWFMSTYTYTCTVYVYALCGYTRIYIRVYNTMYVYIHTCIYVCGCLCL